MKIISVSNAKGGVGKTTIVQNLGVIFAKHNKKTLIIDLDTQCNLTATFNLLKEPNTILQLLKNEKSISECIKATNIKNLDIICGSKNLKELIVYDDNPFMLKHKLDLVQYDYIFIDTPPNLEGTTKLALYSCNSVLLPTKADMFSINGLIDDYKKIQEVKQINKDLYIEGIILNEYTRRFLLNRELENKIEKVANTFNTKVYKTTLRSSVQIPTSQANYKCIIDFNKKSGISEDYENLYKEIIRRANK